MHVIPRMVLGRWITGGVIPLHHIPRLTANPSRLFTSKRTPVYPCDIAAGAFRHMS